ncbi:endolytic transglycosylase MltG [uncultured Fibrobacter sp.]|uniref:endolytic transglycosylase MltG n=1 Tax=uncultured Fibrobacter sp. TaxID=261512 RepID=UPI0026270B3D|nr:endolytic transglycosylase MltG [uncultured Fibrobacter sp.]
MKKILLFLALILALLGTFAAINIKSRLSETAQNKDTVLLEVPRGSSPTKIFQILEKNGIWSDDLAFRLTIRKMKPNLKAGWFEIPAGLTLPQVLSIIESGKNAVRHVTIPEGRASWEIPSYIKKAYPNFSEERWNKLVQDPKFAHSLGIEANSLEGYLLPDTYPFPIDADEEVILKQMVAANLKLRDEMQKAPGSMWETLGNWHKVLTLASVVEEETGIPEERPLIAGVFHNRLRIGMPLGADPTVRFIFRNLTGPIYKSQLNSDSPYNTRKFKGLMPGPISNPGRKAIQAALFPAQTDALYFVAKDDGSMTHFFSKNLSDHNRYKDVAARNRGE